MDILSDGVTIRDVTDEDRPDWLAMWTDYCEFYQVTVPDTVTHTTFRRILDPESVVKSVIARSVDGQALGFANYVLHPHTWSARTLCYLEDLFVRPEARGVGVGHALISHLIQIGTERDWARVYWHTNNENTTARRLYDRFVPADEYVRYKVLL